MMRLDRRSFIAALGLAPAADARAPKRGAVELIKATYISQIKFCFEGAGETDDMKVPTNGFYVYSTRHLSKKAKVAVFVNGKPTLWPEGEEKYLAAGWRVKAASE